MMLIMFCMLPPGDVFVMPQSSSTKSIVIPGIRPCILPALQETTGCGRAQVFCVLAVLHKIKVIVTSHQALFSALVPLYYIYLNSLNLKNKSWI